MTSNILSLFDIRRIISEDLCYQVVREMRWPDGTICPHCDATHTIKYGKDDKHTARQNYLCKSCNRYFDDLTNTIFAGRHQPLSVWILCLYFMGLNLSNNQISQELNLNKDDTQAMTDQLRGGVVIKKPEPLLSNEVECDEVYVVAGHKGNQEAVRKKQRKGRRNRLKGAKGRGTLEKEKPPIFGMIERGGLVCIKMLENVKQATITPLIEKTIATGAKVFTDEYNIYNRLGQLGYEHKTVCHGRGEYARDEDGDGFHEVHVNTIEGFWSLLRSWLRPHRGISQEKLPNYIGFFEFTHNVKKRGKQLLGSLLELFLTTNPESI
jgi:transposase-like protein